MKFKISSVDHEPDDLPSQIPFRGRLVRQITGTDRPDYWLAELERPLSWMTEGGTKTIRHLLLKARWAGTAIQPGAKIPVGICYVIDDGVLSASSFTPAQAVYVAIGMVKVAGRPVSVLAVFATWVAFLAGLFAGGDLEDAGSWVVAAVVGAILVVLGFAAASQRRTLLSGARARPARLLALAIVVGAALGLANLAANWTIARAHPALRALLVERMAALQPLVGVIGSPVVEEIVVRLFLMSAIAWIVFGVTRRASLAFVVALVGSAFVFALLHLDRPFPGDPALADLYRTTLLIKYTLAGIPLGWIFWRWGLPYSIACHIAANAVHLAIQDHVF